MKSKPSKKVAKFTRKPIEFNYDELLASLRGHREHLQGKKKLILRTWTVEVLEGGQVRRRIKGVPSTKGVL